jgi:hypothetical protein
MAKSKTNNPRSAKRGKYDVALSFAEEDRSFVNDVAEYLRQHDIRFFYDDDKRIETWGINLYTYLDEVYREEATYCVLFISRYYKEKRWTNHERVRAQARAFYENQEYVLPFKFDNTEIEELQDSIAYLTVERYNAAQLAQAIVDKVELNKSSWSRTRKRAWKIFNPRLRKLTLLLATCSVLTYSLADKFTPVDILARKLYEKNRRMQDKAKCNDSTTSRSKGSGTCSRHKGVAYYFKDTSGAKTMEECRREAAKISLFN